MKKKKSAKQVERLKLSVVCPETMDCLYKYCFRHCFDFIPGFHVSSTSPANSRVSSSNVSQDFGDNRSFYESAEQDTFLTSPARNRWIEAINQVVAELSEVSVN